MAHPFQTVVYVQIRRRWVSIRVMSWAGGDNRWEGEPRFFSVRDSKGKEKVVEAEKFSGEGTLPNREFCLFSHPRVAIDQLEDTIRGMRLLLRRAKLKKAPARPAFVFHLREKWDRGLADIEFAAFTRLGRSCGAGRVLISEEAHELPAPEVLTLAKGRGNRLKD